MRGSEQRCGECGRGTRATTCATGGRHVSRSAAARRRLASERPLWGRSATPVPPLSARGSVSRSSVLAGIRTAYTLAGAGEAAGSGGTSVKAGAAVGHQRRTVHFTPPALDCGSQNAAHAGISQEPRRGIWATRPRGCLRGRGGRHCTVATSRRRPRSRRSLEGASQGGPFPMPPDPKHHPSISIAEFLRMFALHVAFHPLFHPPCKHQQNWGRR